jgi:deoxyribonuclease-2
MTRGIILGLIAASAVVLVTAELACKDHNGNDVDWFVVYKLPYQKDYKEPINTGFSYAYMTGKPLKGGKEGTDAWRLSDVLTTDTKSIFGKTLAPLHSAPRKYTHLMYNDDPPHGSGEFLRLEMKH